MLEQLELIVEIEEVPGVVSQVTINRELLTTLGDLLIQLAHDPTRTGALLVLHEDGDVSLSSKGIGTEAGHA